MGGRFLNAPVQVLFFVEEAPPFPRVPTQQSDCRKSTIVQLEQFIEMVGGASLKALHPS